MPPECPACGDSFSTAHGVKSHHKQVHGETLDTVPGADSDPVECPTCGGEFKSQRTVQSHHTQVHDESLELEPPPGCDWLHEHYIDYGWHTTEIADECNVSATTIKRWLDRCDIEMRSIAAAKTEGNIDHLRDEAWLRERYCDEEQSMSEIADVCDLSVNAVKSWLNRHEIERRTLSEQMSDGEIEKLHDEAWLREQYVEKGKSTTEIGGECGVSDGTVGNWLDRHDIERRGLSEIHADGEIASLKDPEWLRTQYWDEGKTAEEIGTELGVYGSTVNRWLDRHNIEKKGQSVARAGESIRQLEDAEWLREQYHKQGLSTVKIGEKLGVSSRCVNDWMERHGIERRGMEGEENPMWKGGKDDYYGPSWHPARRAVRERDGDECQRCGMSNQEHIERFGQGLHVHHITPFRTFDDHAEANELSNLITVCRECHDMWEGVPLDFDG